MKLKLIIIICMLFFIIGCNSSFNDCMSTCINIKQGFGRNCGFGICVSDYNDVNETIREICFNECKPTTNKPINNECNFPTNPECYIIT